MVGKQLCDLNLQRNFGCTVTRVRRSGIDLSPSPDLELRFGDKLMIVGEKEGIQAVARLIGNDVKKLSDTDFFPIAMGIVLGVLFGKLNISFGGGVSFSPGLTGGILMMALFLSAIGKQDLLSGQCPDRLISYYVSLVFCFSWQKLEPRQVRHWCQLFRRVVFCFSE